jgi:hypothetical protein
MFAFSDARPGGKGLAIAEEARHHGALKSVLAAANAAPSAGTHGGGGASAAVDATAGEIAALTEEIQVTTNPEPATLGLVGIGLAALAGVVRRRARRG